MSERVSQEAVEAMAAEQGPRWPSRKAAWADGYREGQQQARMTGSDRQALREQLEAEAVRKVEKQLGIVKAERTELGEWAERAEAQIQELEKRRDELKKCADGLFDQFMGEQQRAIDAEQKLAQLEAEVRERLGRAVADRFQYLAAHSSAPAAWHAALLEFNELLETAAFPPTGGARGESAMSEQVERCEARPLGGEPRCALAADHCGVHRAVVGAQAVEWGEPCPAEQHLEQVAQELERRAQEAREDGVVEWAFHGENIESRSCFRAYRAAAALLRDRAE